MVFVHKKILKEPKKVDTAVTSSGTVATLTTSITPASSLCEFQTVETIKNVRKVYHNRKSVQIRRKKNQINLLKNKQG